MRFRTSATRVQLSVAALLLALGVTASATSPGSSLTQLKPLAIVASQAEAEGPAPAAIDGDLNTQWTSSGVGSHLTLDWGAIRLVRQVRIAFYNGNARVYGFQIQSSLDGERYFAAGSFVSSGNTSTFESFDLNATGRYLRIVGWGNSINRYNAYNEVQAYVAR